MIKTYHFFLLGILAMIGCQATPETTAVEPAGDAATAMTRPDPLNPTGENFAVPTEWIVRLDRPDPDAVVGANADSADIFFVNMTPGWHITTGPSGIFYHPLSTAAGEYEALADIHLFNPGDRLEAFGLIFGGQNLDAENQSYDYFLIRNSGEFLIKRRRGSETEVIHDWTMSDAIKSYTNPEESSVMNQLKIRVGEEAVTFLINDKEVVTLPRDQLQTEGVVGLRVNHALNLHVSDLAVHSVAV